MARLTDRGFTEEEAAEFMDRANGPHTLRWTAEIYRWVGGEENTLMAAGELPIVGGTLTLDGSDPTRRKLSLDIAGGEDLIPDQPYDPLAPFGQVIKLWVQIDRADGSWFDRLKMGEYPIQTTTTEWPSMTQTVEASDYSWLVDQYLFEKRKSYNHKTVRQAVEDIVKDALPDSEFFIQSPGDAHDIKVEPHTVAEAGTGRWEFVQTLCQARGFDTFFNHNGNLVIRHDVTNNSDEVETIPGEGPDIGTVSDPVAVIRDGPGGNLVALTVGLTREGAVNGVFINVHETISQRVVERKKREAEAGAPGPPEEEPDPDYEPDWDDVLRGDAPPPPDPDDPDPPPDPDPDHDHGDPEVPTIPNPKAGDPRVNVQVKALGVGPIKWGDKFGRQNIVLARDVKRINDNVINAQIHRAKRLLHKRGGVIRSVDLDAVGLYWLEPDDKVRVKYAGRTEAHYVASVELDLSGAEPARVRTRSLNVTDPGSAPSHTYTEFSTAGTHSFTPAAGVTSVDVLLVGGGGGGGGVDGSGSSGGGGGGGVFRIDDVAVTPGVAHTVEVGGGGAGGTGGARGGHGDESFFNGGAEVYYAGGGGGGGYHTGSGGGNGGNGRSEGGSGGGGGSATSGTAGTGGTGDGAPVAGHGGGGGFVSSTSAGRNGGGGGGAGVAGGDAATGGGGGGGAGVDMSGFVGTSYGDAGWFGGGGGGGGHAAGTTGGRGGGGSGGGWSGGTPQPGAANTGGGGGGLGSFSGSDGSGRAGGSGVVVVRTVTEPG